jgi:hypothetical protein
MKKLRHWIPGSNPDFNEEASRLAKEGNCTDSKDDMWPSQVVHESNLQTTF